MIDELKEYESTHLTNKPLTLADIYPTLDPNDKIEYSKDDPIINGAPHILDSGNRREFGTGAVRDMAEGKGRCDLMPLDVVSMFYKYNTEKEDDCNIKDTTDDVYWVFKSIDSFLENENILDLLNAIGSFKGFDNAETMLLEVAKHFEEGCKKYGENNWRKGIPVKFYIDSAIRHYLKYLRGDKDEPHDRAFCWNVLCAIWTHEHKPELRINPEEPKTEE